MNVTALGHAGLQVKTSTGRLLVDPWFSPTGAFQASWFQFPDNSHLLDKEKLYEADAIIISHEHMDHVDPWFLAKIPSSIPAVVPRYPSSVLKQKILMGGHREIIELEEWEEYEVTPGTKVFFVKEPPMNHDAAIIITGDGHSLLNMNDARLFPMQLRDIKQKVGGHINMFTFQGAGASWYPMCYGYNHEKARELSRQKRMAKLVYCLKSMKIVEPTIGIPLAGPPAFLDPELFKYNSEMENEGIFPDQQQVVDYLAKKKQFNCAVLLPGDCWDMENKLKVQDSQWSDFSFDNRREYLKEYQQRKLADIERYKQNFPEPDKSLESDFRSYFTKLQGMSKYFNERINMRVGFDITGAGGGQWYVDFRPGQEEIGNGLEDCGYIYTIESKWMPSLLDGSTPFEDFFLSLRFQARRNPDLYNDHLLGLLKFAEPEALEEVERFETASKSEERITIHSEGKIYSVSRFCPHAGNDFLHSGEVVPGGFLRCLAHNYDFDLNNGNCVTGICEAIKVDCIGEIGDKETA